MTKSVGTEKRSHWLSYLQGVRFSRAREGLPLEQPKPSLSVAGGLIQKQLWGSSGCTWSLKVTAEILVLDRCPARQDKQHLCGQPSTIPMLCLCLIPAERLIALLCHCPLQEPTPMESPQRPQLPPPKAFAALFFFPV